MNLTQRIIETNNRISNIMDYYFVIWVIFILFIVIFVIIPHLGDDK